MRKPRVNIPSSPIALVLVGTSVGGKIQGVSDGEISGWEPTALVSAFGGGELIALEAQALHNECVEARNLAKLKCEQRDAKLAELKDRLRDTRDAAFGQITDGNYARLGELGFNVLVTPSSSNESGNESVAAEVSSS